MASGSEGGYLPGDPRYGLSGDRLRRYYSEKPAQNGGYQEDSRIYRWEFGD